MDIGDLVTLDTEGYLAWYRNQPDDATEFSLAGIRYYKILSLSEKTATLQGVEHRTILPAVPRIFINV